MNVLGILGQHLWAVFSVYQIKTYFVSRKLGSDDENVIYEGIGFSLPIQFCDVSL